MSEEMQTESLETQTEGIAEAPAEPVPSAEDAAPTSQEGIADAPQGKQEGKDGGKDGGAQKQEPEDYSFSPTEDFPMPEENLNGFAAACKKAGLTRAQAESLLDWHKEQYKEDTAWQATQLKNTRAAWDKAILEDQDFGGSVKNYKETVAAARRALDAFDEDGSLRQALKETSWQYNPTVVKALARVGRAMGEHGFVSGNGHGGGGTPLADRYFK